MQDATGLETGGRIRPGADPTDRVTGLLRYLYCPIMPLTDPGPDNVKSPIPRLLPNSSLNRALSVLGDGWVFRVLRHAFLGVSRFDEFHGVDGINRRTLSKVLKQLLEEGIFYAKPYQYKPLRQEYKLTDKGLALLPTMLMLRTWYSRWGDPAHATPYNAFDIRHRNCGKLFTPRMVCLHCRDEVSIRQVHYEVVSGASGGEAMRPSRHRWSGDETEPADGRATLLHSITDRWSHLILGAIFIGRHSYTAIRQELGIASGVLAHRLALLHERGFISKRRTRPKVERYTYHLTPMSRDVFRVTLTLMQWSREWLSQARSWSVIEYHVSCGERLVAAVVCSECGETLRARDLQREPHTAGATVLA